MICLTNFVKLVVNSICITIHIQVYLENRFKVSQKNINQQNFYNLTYFYNFT